MDDKLEGGILQQNESQFSAKIKQIQEIFKREYNLTIPEKSRVFVTRCLLQKDRDLDKAVKLIRTFHDVIVGFKDWNIILKPSLHGDLFTSTNSYFNVLAQTDDAGRHVILLRPELWNPKTKSLEQVLTCFWMFMQYINGRIETVPQKGYILIVDSSLSLEQGLALKFRRVLSLTQWTQNGVIGRMKAIHIINHPRICDVIHAALKPFLTEKMKSRAFFHKSVESLLKHVPARILPDYLGGHADAALYKDDAFLNEFIQQDEYFEDMIKYGFPTR